MTATKKVADATTTKRTRRPRKAEAPSLAYSAIEAALFPKARNERPVLLESAVLKRGIENVLGEVDSNIELLNAEIEALTQRRNDLLHMHDMCTGALGIVREAPQGAAALTQLAAE